MLTLSQLHAFQAVARHRHFTRAAEELQVAQPSVSYQLRALERRLNVRLVYVVGHRVFLTDAGERLAERATAVLNDLEDVEHEMRDYAQGIGGRLRLGATHTVGVYALPSVLAAFRQARPQVELRLTIDNVRAIEQLLLDHALDLGVVEWTVQSPELVTEPWRRYAIVLIGPPQHPLTERLTVPREELRGETFVLREPGSGLRALSDAVLAPLGTSVHIALELDQPEAIVRAVQAGLGLAFVPELVAAPQLAAGTVRTIALADVDLGHDFALVRLRDRPVTPAADAFQISLAADRGTVL
jgi:DNA-binding transcriptional LysR family regulator